MVGCVLLWKELQVTAMIVKIELTKKIQIPVETVFSSN